LPSAGTWSRDEKSRPHDYLHAAGAGPLVREGGHELTSHGVTIAGYLVVLAGIMVLQVLATRTGAPIPSLGDLFTRAMRSRTGRVGVLVAWAWLGLHFFAR
jgi:hypothetical protein